MVIQIGLGFILQQDLLTVSILGQGRGLTLLRTVPCNQGKFKVPEVHEMFLAYACKAAEKPASWTRGTPMATIQQESWYTCL